MPSSQTLSRRRFLQTSAAAAAYWTTAASYARIPGSNERLNVAFIGVGGIAAGQHIGQLKALGADCACYCDADRDRMQAGRESYPNATAYTDYRRMFDAQHKDFDAVMVGTPDHQHYPPTIIAMMLGKHAYTQKPLTHTVWEARQLGIAQERYKVATQMGNQGHAWDGLYRVVDYLSSGVIGDLIEAHVWTNRPWWRQGMSRPAGSEVVPENLDWEAWIGPAPMRPFRHEPADGWGGLYHPFNWRGWWDFGCGALGDMGCHELDPVYWAMMPGQPTAVELIATRPFGDAEMFGRQSTVRFEFAARGDRPGFRVYWYEGRKPPKPESLADDVELAGEGGLYYGTKGVMISQPNARSAPQLLPVDEYEGVDADIGQYIERSADGHHKEWYLSCIGERPYDHPKGNFAYSAALTEAVLLGCVAQRVGGRLEYDSARSEFVGRPDATALLTKPYREGWDFRMDPSP